MFSHITYEVGFDRFPSSAKASEVCRHLEFVSQLGKDFELNVKNPSLYTISILRIFTVNDLA